MRVFCQRSSFFGVKSLQADVTRTYVWRETDAAQTTHASNPRKAHLPRATSFPPHLETNSLHRRSIETVTTSIMADDKSDADTSHQDSGSQTSPSPRAGGNGAGADDLGATEQDADSFNNNIPVFLDRTFRMIENVPDDVLCWSAAGDSFMIKQVRLSSKRCGTSRASLKGFSASW